VVWVSAESTTWYIGLISSLVISSIVSYPVTLIEQELAELIIYF